MSEKEAILTLCGETMFEKDEKKEIAKPIDVHFGTKRMTVVFDNGKAVKMPNVNMMISGSLLSGLAMKNGWFQGVTEQALQSNKNEWELSQRVLEKEDLELGWRLSIVEGPFDEKSADLTSIVVSVRNRMRYHEVFASLLGGDGDAHKNVLKQFFPVQELIKTSYWNAFSHELTNPANFGVVDIPGESLKTQLLDYGDSGFPDLFTEQRQNFLRFMETLDVLESEARKANPEFPQEIEYLLECSS